MDPVCRLLQIMSSDAPPVPLKATCPFCTGRLSDHDRNKIQRKVASWPIDRFVSCGACKSVFRMVPAWLRLMFSTFLLGFAIVFAVLLVAAAHLIYRWLSNGGELSAFTILVLSMITGMLAYGGVRSSEQFFHYGLNNMLILVSHPDFEKEDWERRD